MKTLNINASKSYPIIINDSLDGLKKLISEKFNNSKKVIVISDSNVFPLYGKEVLSLIEKDVFSFVIPAGEDSKNFKNYMDILGYMAKNGFSRCDGVVGLGGGVVGDLAGFVSSTYMRGINYIAVPTTILAFVDSSVGGKTAINLDYGKNLVGTFYQPNGVFINYSFSKTLPKREVQSGFGEIVKYYFITENIADNELIGGLSEELIYKCIECKAKIVENDELDRAGRKLLNFGHTFGHAIEKLSGYALSHGECVIKGIYLSLLVSLNLSRISLEQFENSKQILQKLGYNLVNDYSLEEIAKLIKMDKKSDGETVDFVLLNGQGKLQIEKIGFDKLIGAVYECKNNTK